MNAVSSTMERHYTLAPVDAVAQTSPDPIPQPHRHRRKHILPGFHLTLGFTIFYLSAIVLLPLAALFLKTVTPNRDFPTVGAVVRHVLEVTTSERSLDSYRLSFGIAFAAALTNGVFGFMVAWALTRYQFPGKNILDALVDLPFAMPTAVAGLALTQIFMINGGYIGQVLYNWFGWRIAFTSWGILVALIFIGFPFVVRTLQPVITGLAVEVEEAAACLGANRWQTFRRVIFPAIGPALITGMMLAFGRGVGEYGSVVFISSMQPYRTEITPQLIVIKL
ncbi:MAG: sulfate ABC transporter permease subunit CysT, partial [Methylacidiphilales bacterium]|nr:sulfate ABC transporter permease subunit CysT [Candidatus Methylacidiphilales bacterium]